MHLFLTNYGSLVQLSPSTHVRFHSKATSRGLHRLFAQTILNSPATLHGVQPH